MDNQLDSKDSYKEKNPIGGGMHRCLPLLKKKVRLLEIHEC
jgi:hypothetical protein